MSVPVPRSVPADDGGGRGLDVRARGGQGGVDLEGAPEHRRRLLPLLERDVTEALTAERTEVPGLAGERLAAVGDGALEVLGHVADGGSLVPALGELRRGLDERGERGLGGREILLLHRRDASGQDRVRSEEHTSELQSQSNLVCRLLLEKKNTYDL